jgi:hypothetical protein
MEITKNYIYISHFFGHVYDDHDDDGNGEE